ncbi:unnamed protein product [Merluccius merluccius]
MSTLRLFLAGSRHGRVEGLVENSSASSSMCFSKTLIRNPEDFLTHTHTGPLLGPSPHPGQDIHSIAALGAPPTRTLSVPMAINHQSGGGQSRAAEATVIPTSCVYKQDLESGASVDTPV